MQDLTLLFCAHFFLDASAPTQVVFGGILHARLRDVSERKPMETATQHDSRVLPSCPITGSQRLTLWKAAQKQLHGKLDPQEIIKVREEWDQTPRTRRA